MANEPETLMVKVAQGNWGLAQRFHPDPQPVPGIDAKRPTHRQQGHPDPRFYASSSFPLSA
jgi:hypothetical protein